jgi:hypothetical protein
MYWGLGDSNYYQKHGRIYNLELQALGQDEGKKLI